MAVSEAAVSHEDADFTGIGVDAETAPGGAIQVPLIFTDITATAGADYQSSATFTFAATGATRHALEIKLLGDTLCEGDETFRVEIDASKLPAGVTVGTQSSTVVTIRDTANACAVTIAGGSAVREGAKAEFTVSTAQDVAADLTVSDVSGSDFIAAGDEGSKSVTVVKGAKSATYEVRTVRDANIETSGDVTVAIRNDAAYSVGSPSSAMVRVNDDDGALRDGLLFPSGPESESIQVAANVVTSGRNHRVQWGIGSAGTATYSKGDYAMGSTKRALECSGFERVFQYHGWNPGPGADKLHRLAECP